MNDSDSPNYHEYVYSKKAKGKNLICRILMIMLYTALVLGFFLICYITRIIPIFALSPLFLWIIVFFTWKYVSYDIYFEFKSGILEIGIIRISKKGNKKRNKKISISVKDAIYIAPLSDGKPAMCGVNKIYDFSESAVSKDRILIIFNDENIKKSALIFEGTSKIANLLSSFCKNTHNLKGQEFHG